MKLIEKIDKIVDEQRAGWYIAPPSKLKLRKSPEAVEIEKIFSSIHHWLEDARKQFQYKNYKDCLQTLKNIQNKPLKDLINRVGKMK